VGLGVGVAGTDVGVAVGGGTGSNAGGVGVITGVAEGVPVGSVTAAGEQPHSTAASVNASSPERILPDTAKGYLRSSGLRPAMTFPGEGEKQIEYFEGNKSSLKDTAFQLVLSHGVSGM